MSNKILKKMNFGSEKIKGPKKFGSKTISHNWVSNSWDILDMYVQMLPGQISTWQMAFIKDVPRNLPLDFGHNRISNSWDITDMDKCRQDKCCLDECHRYSWNLIKMVKIGSVTAEIMQTLSLWWWWWTKVTFVSNPK